MRGPTKETIKKGLTVEQMQKDLRQAACFLRECAVKFDELAAKPEKTPWAMAQKASAGIDEMEKKFEGDFVDINW